MLAEGPSVELPHGLASPPPSPPEPARRSTTLARQALLGAGIWVIEGLDLSEIEPGEYELICLPLRVEDGDGAPARAILRK